MAVGYFSKAMSRAAPAFAAPIPPAHGVRPASRSGSPLAEDDQRLHDNPDMTAPSTPVISPLTPPVSPLMPPATPGSQPSLNAEQRAQPSAASSDPAVPALAAAALPDGTLATEATPPASSVLDAKTGPAESLEGLREPVLDFTLQPIPTSGRQDLPEDVKTAAQALLGPPPSADEIPPSPVTALSRALTVAENWVTGTSSDTAPEGDTIQSVTAMKLAHENTAPLTEKRSVQPILQPQPDPPRPSLPPSRPLVEIGSIEVEIVAPPAPKDTRPAPRPQPTKSPPPRVAPFGSRQR